MQVDLEPPDSPLDLVRLARALVAPGMPSQAVIGLGAGVSQSTVSRAAAQKIGDTPSARRLWTYVLNRPEESPLPTEGSAPLPPIRRKRRQTIAKLGDPDLKQAALNGLRAYLDDEFDPQLVLDQLAVLRRAQRVNARGKKRQRAAQ